MKKIITVFLVLALAAGMGFSPTAYATGEPETTTIITEANGSATIGVGAKYGQAETAKKYYVVVDIPDLTFTCSITGQLEWNPQTMTYMNGTNYGIGADQVKTATVKNQSNAPIWVTVEYAKIDDVDKEIADDFRLVATPTELEIDSVEGYSDPKWAPTRHVALSIVTEPGARPDPKPEGSSESKTVAIGTLTIRLSSTNPSEGSTETTEASTTQSGSQP